MPEYSIGVDLGGTNLRAAAISIDGKLIDKISESTDLEEGHDPLLDDIADGIRKLRDRVGADGLIGVGIGVPGFIRMDEGIVVGSNNLPELEGRAGARRD